MRLIFSHLDRTSLVNKGFMIQQKDYRFIKNQHLFISKDWRGGSLCLWRINLRELFKFIVYVFFVFIVFCHFLQLYPQYCPSIKKLVCMLEVIFFLALIQSGKSPSGKMGPLRWAIRLILPMGSASDVINSHTHIHFICVILVAFSW